VAGTIQTLRDSFDYGILALDADSGARRWSRRFDGYGGADFAYDIVSGPHGSRVFVTGSSAGPSGPSITTVALGAARGTQRWVARQRGVVTGSSSLGISPKGSTVFVAGQAYKSSVAASYLTLGYAADSGSRRWTARYRDPEWSIAAAHALALAPDGEMLFVTGESFVGGWRDLDTARDTTIAYRS
jgi:hypothetical protein